MARMFVYAAQRAVGKNSNAESVPASTTGTGITFEELAQAYLEDYTLQRYRSMNTAKPRVGPYCPIARPNRRSRRAIVIVE